MENLNERFTVKVKRYEETSGMVKGKSTTRTLITVKDNGVFLKDFTRSDFKFWICICVGGRTSEGAEAVSVECKTSENATKKTMAHLKRKNEDFKCLIKYIES